MDDEYSGGDLRGPPALDEFMTAVKAILADERAGFLEAVRQRLEGMPVPAEVREQHQSRRLMKHLIAERIILDLETWGYGLNTAMAQELQALLIERLDQ